MVEMGTPVPVTGGALGGLLNSLDVGRTESLRAVDRSCRDCAGVLEFG
jgi:hypothetical protein